MKHGGRFVAIAVASRVARITLALAALLCASRARADDPLRVGSKRFTESFVLAEIAAAVSRDAGERVVHREGLGGTAIAFAALEGGDIDLYPEYTGTLVEAILHASGSLTLAEVRARLAAKGLGVSEPLGFENTYALAVSSASPRTPDIARISDLARRSELVLGLSNEFAGRQDGWPGLSRHYGLEAFVPETMDHGLAYEALERGAIDVMEVYSTDAKIKRYALRVLEDDRHFFPSYEAVFVYRLELPQKFPRAWAALRRLDGRIDASEMVELNAGVELSKRSAAEVAGAFVRAMRDTADGSSESPARNLAPPRSWLAGMLRVVADDGPRHVMLVAVSLLLAVAVGVPLGIAAHNVRGARGVILMGAGVLQTIPALALLCFFIPLLGIGVLPTLAALFLYSLLPIVRNTFTGLQDVPSALRESAIALGLPRWRRLVAIELPLASRTVLAGIKTAAVINVGTATVAAFIGAGGFGRPISTGLNLNDNALILQGAVPAALLALGVQALFDALERVVVPRGLRLDARRASE